MTIAERDAWTTLGVGAQPAEDRSREPTSACSELALDSAYRNTMGLDEPEHRVEACACGGVIECPDLERAIAEAVGIHNRSTGHQRWRRAGGIR